MRYAFLAVFLLSFAGCLFGNRGPTLPESNRLIRDQLVVHSEFRLPRQHRLLSELAAQRDDLAQKLDLPTSDEPIHVYLFDSSSDYQAYMARHYPEFPERRAFFVENDTTLSVFAHWGDRVAEDLRHEVAHGYLHSVVPNLPLWMDEGLAEYFEVPRGRRGVNRPHVEMLMAKYSSTSADNSWKPNLSRLEQLRFADEMTQTDYAESWLWVHLMLETTPERLSALHKYLDRLRSTGTAPPFSTVIRNLSISADKTLIEHLQSLANDL